MAFQAKHRSAEGPIGPKGLFASFAPTEKQKHSDGRCFGCFGLLWLLWSDCSALSQSGCYVSERFLTTGNFLALIAI